MTSEPTPTDAESRAWEVIAGIRDAAPRHPEDADTSDIVDGLAAAGLLASHRAQPDPRPWAQTDPAQDKPGIVRELDGHTYVKLTSPSGAPWHIARASGPQNYSGWQDNDTMRDAPVVGYVPIIECYDPALAARPEAPTEQAVALEVDRDAPTHVGRPEAHREEP